MCRLREPRPSDDHPSHLAPRTWRLAPRTPHPALRTPHLALPHLRTSHPAPPTSLLSLIGNTPLLRLTGFDEAIGRGVEIYAKAEWQNPGGSVKDRAAARMIAEGERSGALQPGGTILDATSGNTGIAYAMLGAALGYRVRLCVPANVTPERLRMLRAYGAEVVLTDPMDGSDGAIREARRLHAADPSLLLSRSVQQSVQLARALRHDRTGDLGPDRRPDHALRRRARDQRHVRRHGAPAARAEPRGRVDLDPARQPAARRRRAEAHGLVDRPGHLRPGDRRRGPARRHRGRAGDDAAARARHGLLAGVSSGAALAAALRIAARARDAVIVDDLPRRRGPLPVGTFLGGDR